MALFEKGKSGNPGGRPAGSKNKYKARVDEVFKDFNPLENLKKLALETDDDELRFNCNKELAQYYAPKLKAVEHSVDTENPVKLQINIGNTNE